MNMTKKFVAASVLAALSASANAAYIFDAWQLDTTNAGIASVTTNIGHLNFSGGIGNIHQYLDGGANATALDAGDSFKEFGNIYSLSFTKNNKIGAGDNGGPKVLQGNLTDLQLEFIGLTGKITSVAADGTATYAFDAGAGDIILKGSADDQTTWTDLAHFAMANPSGGDVGKFIGGIQPNGQTDVLAMVSTSGYTSNLFRDSTGASMDSLVSIGRLFGAFHSTNKLDTSNPVLCGLDNDQRLACDLVVTSDGSFDLVPEPTSVALMGLGLIGIAGAARRARKS